MSHRCPSFWDVGGVCLDTKKLLLNGIEFRNDFTEGGPTSLPIEHLYDAVMMNLRLSDSADGW